MKFRNLGLALIAATLFTACAEDTGTIGIFDEGDAVLTVPKTFTFNTRTLPLDSILANSPKCYLGQVSDPATGVVLRAEFLSQFHTFENYRLPDTTLITSRKGGKFVADSIFLRLYFSTYYGDGTNAMKLAVHELDTANVLREDTVIYSTVNLEKFKNPKRTEPLAEKTFTAADYTLTDSVRTSSNHYDNVAIKLPVEYGTNILRMVALHPEYFKDSYQFMRHVCPGFYIQLKSGSGVLLDIDVSTIDIYFTYKHEDKEEKALTRFSATNEVIQSTHIDNIGISEKAPVDEKGMALEPTNDTTYVLSPAGMITELQLPIDAIFKGHEKDSIAQARIIMNRYNTTGTSIFSTPNNLLLLRRSQLKSFFESQSLPSNISSFVSTFESSYNTYTYTDISELVSSLYNEKQSAMKNEGLTSDQYNAKYPIWNHVVLTPVEVTKNSSGTITKVVPEYKLTSTKLVGGKKEVKIQVIFSKNE